MEEKGANNTPSPLPAKRRKGILANRWARRTAYAVATLLGLWLLLWLAVPPLAKWQGEKIASEQLGRKVSIGAIDFKPWTLELTVHDLAMASADGKTPQLTLKRFYANADMESIWRLAPVIDGLQIDEPVLHVTHEGEGHYDFDDILKRLSAKPSVPEKEGEPERFAIYNIDLSGGAIDFDDKAVDRKHEVRDLRLTLPFISNLPSKLKVKVLPHLAFVANGSRFDSTAQTLPFAESLETSAVLRLAKLDLAPYIGYIPAGLPLRLKAATVDADLTLGFEQTPKPSLRLGGSFEVSGLKSVDGQGADAVAFDALKVQLAEVRPLEQLVRLASVELNKPNVVVRRDKKGLVNLLVSVDEDKADQTDKREKGEKVAVKAEVAASEAEPTASAGEKAKAGKAPVWQVAIDKLAVHGGTVHFTDEVPAEGPISAAKVQLNEFELAAEAIGYPFAKPLSFKGSAVLADAEGKTAAQPNTRPVRRGAKSADAPVATGASSLAFEGTATDQKADVTARVDRLPLALASPYLAQAVVPSLTGSLDAQLGLQWAPPEIKLTADRVVLSNLLLADGAASVSGPRAGEKRPSRSNRKSRDADGQLVSVKQVEVADARVDLRTRAASLGKLSVSEPKLRVERDAEKRWMFESWLRQPAETAPSSSPAKQAGTAQANAPWKVVVDEFSLNGGMIGWRDAAMQRPVRAELTRLKVDARKIDLDGGKPMPVTVSALLGTGRAEPGRLSWQGTVGIAPLSAQGAVDAQRLPVHAFEPYFGDTLNIDILRADASFKGQVAYSDTPKGPRAKVSGDAMVEELRTHGRPDSAADANAPEKPGDTTTRRSLGGTTTTTAMAPASASGASQAPVAPTANAGGLGEEFLSWKLLKLGSLEVALEPEKPAQVEVKNTLLSDFFARIIIHSNGRINLQDIVKSDGSADSSATAAAAGGRTAPVVASMPASGEFSAGAGEPAAPASVAAVAQSPADPNAPVIRFGPIRLANGKVLFSDRFIRPNYSADLTELNGSLSAFSSVAPAGVPQMADLQLTGRAEGSAALEITGKLNPLAKPLALDIKGQVRDLELPPLTPYSVKYAGHGIERGKLSMDVAYAIQPDGRLTATNNLVLNQLEFGEAVEGAPASLPVKLATALLADSNGVIDLDLPISGSLNDPQFSIGPIIFKAIVNLIGRAITAPFTLLARALGGGSGGDDLANVPFAPGSASLSADARSRLDKIAKALNDRPALKVTVVGTASLDAERDGWRRERLKALVEAEKRSESGSAATPQKGQGAASAPLPAGSAASAPASALGDEEYAALLKQVYRRADLPGKPRNALGFTKNVPVPEMEALLLDHINVSDDAMRQLAVQRGVAVKDYLAGKKLPADRLFLGAARTGGAAKEAPAASASAAGASGVQGKADKWAPRAELNLSAR